MLPFFSSLTRPARTLPALLAVAATVVGFTACKPDTQTVPAPVPTAGSANFSHYYAVGNSLTAGYADGGVYRESQLSSYPLLLAQQFRLAGGGDFAQPLFSEAQANGSSHLVLQNFLPSGAPNLVRTTTLSGEVPGATIPGGAVLTPYSGPLNNLGVPGISVRDLTNGTYGLLNPFYHRLLPDDAARNSTSYLKFIRQKTADATFFTCWLGNNDVLGYATGGAADPDALTTAAVFEPLYDSALAVLTRRGAKGVCATIPNVTAVPYFTATSVPATIAAVAARPLPAGLPTGARLRLSARKTPFTGVVQVIKPLSGADLFTLGAASVLADTTTRRVSSSNPLTVGLRVRLRQGEVIYAANGSIIAANALASGAVLDSLEITRAQAATTALNNIIKATAARYQVPVADMNVFFDNINRNGFVTSGIRNTTAFITGNLFSLDGVHPAPRGYAVITNELLRVINEKYGATLPLIDAGQYRGVKLP